MGEGALAQAGSLSPADNYGYQREYDREYRDNNWWIVRCWIKEKTGRGTETLFARNFENRQT